MSSDILFQLHGACLWENVSAYRLFELLGSAKPGLVLALGGWSKRQYLSREYSIAFQHSRYPSAALAIVNRDTIWIDCELHLRTHDCPPAHPPPPDNCVVHPFGQTAPALRPVHGLYFNVLSLFSDVVLIFVPDLGGITETVEFLGLWLNSIIAKESWPCPRFVLLHQDTADFEGMNSAIAAACLSKASNTCIPKGATTTIRNALRISHVLLRAEVHEVVRADIAASCLEKKAAGRDFSAQHLQTLLQHAILHHTQKPLISFDPIIASRLRYPLPPHLQQSITTFLRGFRKVDNSRQVDIVASALVMDAYPPEMHRKLLP